MFNFINLFKNKKLIKKDCKLDEEGRCLIEIAIKDRSEVLSPYVINGQETINSEFASALDNAVKSIPPKKDIHLNIEGKGLSDQDKNIFALAIKNYYLNSTLESQRKIKNNMILFIIMSIMSLITLTALFLVNYFEVNWLIIEVFDIIVWVFVWEAVDLLAFQRSMIVFDRQRSYKVYRSKISFK